MQNQNYGNHKRFDMLYHFWLFLLNVILFIGAVIYAVQAVVGGSDVFPAILMLIAVVVLQIMYILMRGYPLRVQDRAIRAEENLRHYVLTGKLLDSRLRVKQIVALRFASDEELPELAAQAAEQNLKPDEIKKQIRQWRSDFFRV